MDDTPVAADSSTMAMIKRLGIIAGAIAAVLGLIFLFYPDLKPQPRPAVSGGTIEEIAWQSPSPTSLQFSVTARIVGFRGQPCPVGYDIYYSNGTLAMPGLRSLVEFTPDSDDDTGGESLQISRPALPGSYYVQFVLFAPNGTKLDTAQSAFTIS